MTFFTLISDSFTLWHHTSHFTPVSSSPFPLFPSYQSLPLRPQNLYIVGAGLLKRLAINALIKFASVFSNSKVLARIQVRWCGGDACACVLGGWEWY